jgi:hypothetical protein
MLPSESKRKLFYSALKIKRCPLHPLITLDDLIIDPPIWGEVASETARQVEKD